MEFFVPSTIHQNWLDKSMELHDIEKLKNFSNFFFDNYHITKNLFSSVRVYVLFFRTKRKIEYPKSRKKIQLGEDVSF